MAEFKPAASHNRSRLRSRLMFTAMVAMNSVHRQPAYFMFPAVGIWLA